MKQNLNSFSILLISFFLFEIQSVHANESMKEFLSNFHRDPALMMQRLPSMVDADGSVRPRSFILDDQHNWNKVLLNRSEIRNRLMHVGNFESQTIIKDYPPTDPGNDDPLKLVDPGPLTTSLSEMETKKLQAFQIPKDQIPWADSYWPLYEGMTAIRYADSAFPFAKEWQPNYDYIQEHLAKDIAATGTESEINNLSPAEKYDLVTGDTNFTLTNYAWDQGKQYLASDGKVPTWMGICHGWSGAAHMLAEYPKAPVSVHGVDGREVRFYPQDIKALLSMLWANGSPPTRFAGNRCTATRPATNRNGRIIDPNCFDVSPRTWHLAAINQLVERHRSFVMDATYDLEVWNFPIIAIRYQYFNPETWEEGGKLRSVMIPLQEFKIDKFPEFRAKNTKSIVGIFMDVTYVVEINPNRDLVERIPTKTVRYVYDLELDENQNILGGEWYSNAHPDFIWTYELGAEANAREDKYLIGDIGSPQENIPAEWSTYARSASLRGIPLHSFLMRLLP